MSVSSQDLQMLRLLLAQQSDPIKVTPVNDIGGGIAVGAGNIANAIMQRRQQQQLAQMMAYQQQAAHQAMQQKVEAYRAIGMTDEQAQASAMDDVLGRQIQEQGYKDRGLADKADQQQKTWNSYYDALITKGYSMPDAQILANTAVFGERALAGSDKIAEQAQNVANLSDPVMKEAITRGQTQQPSSYEQAVFNALGIKFDPLYTRLDQANNIAKGGADATIRQYEAQVAPEKVVADLQATQLANQGKGIQNQLDQNNLNRDDSTLALQLQALQHPEQINPQTLALITAMTGKDPAGALSGLYGKDKMFTKLDQMAIPPEALTLGAGPVGTPTQPQTQSTPPSFAPSAFNAFNSNLNINPEQRGSMFRKQLQSGFSNGVSNLGNALGQGVLGAGQFGVDAGNTVKGFLGLPFNPTDPFGNQQRGINGIRQFLGR